MQAIKKMALVCIGLALLGNIGEPAYAKEKPDTYLCEFKGYGSKSDQSWVPKKVSFEVVPKEQKVNLRTAYGDRDLGKPSPITSVDGFEGSRLVVKWRIDNASTTGTHAISVGYTLRMNKKTGRANIRGVLRGYDNDIDGSGNCSLL